MIDSYRTIITDRTAEHSRVLHALAEDSVPALMHCAAGKDRAGLSIAVTLLAVGVEREAIEAGLPEVERAAPPVPAYAAATSPRRDRPPR